MGIRQSEQTGSAIDFAIITALAIERRAILRALGWSEKRRTVRGSRTYWCGRLGQYEIVVAQSPDVANVDAALLISDTLHHWHPGAMLLTGIAAAAGDDQDLGDIVVASQVLYYERGKETPEGLQVEPYIYPVDATLLDRIASMPTWKPRDPVGRPDGTFRNPKVQFGVIASGERVIADKSERDRIVASHRKIKAIEMEAYGFSKAVWNSFERVRHLVIRAICDRADPLKDDRWHSYAANIAARFTVAFLRDFPVEPLNTASLASYTELELEKKKVGLSLKQTDSVPILL